MEYCVDYAFANRKVMMYNIMDIMKRTMKKYENKKVSFEPMINIAHNYATMEKHLGKNLMIHRKGATLARKGTIGIIPGSQGTNSYIVEGRGNWESFNSCSHGAGRKMSRKAAKSSLNLEKEMKKMEKQNIIHSMTSRARLDEAPGSYKDIHKVMGNQKDLVKIITELRPIACIKGE